MDKETLSIRQIRKLEKKKEKEVFKEREKDLFYKLRCLILNIDELIDIMLEDEGEYHTTSEYVEIDTYGLIDVSAGNVDYVKELTKTIYNDIVETNKVKNQIGLEVYEYPRVLESYSDLIVKMYKTKYVVTHLKRNDKPFDTDRCTMKVEVKKHKHDFKYMIVESNHDRLKIKLK